jgi:hypothetical protein
MPENPSKEQPAVHPEVGYEKTDATVRPIAAIGTGIVLLITFGGLLSLWLFDVLEASWARRQPGLSPLAAQDRPILPQDIHRIPPPRLQVNETRDIDALLRGDEERLRNYGWVDPQKDKVHLPIAEAMRLLADPEVARSRGIRVEPAKGKAAAGGGGP